MKCFHFFKAIVLVAGLIAPVAAQGTFTSLGEPNSRATGISADGKIVVGSYALGGGAWRWTAAEGLQRLGGDAPFLGEVRISRDGRTIVYNDRDSQGYVSAAIWEGGSNWRTLGGVPGGAPGGTDSKELSTAYDVSGDGSAIVRLAWTKTGSSTGFRWDASTGMVELGKLRSGSSRASMISTDGHLIAGWESNVDVNAQSRAGVIWWNGLARLLHPFSWTGEVIKGNDAGTVLVGRGSPGGFGHAFRWLAGGDARTEDLGIANLAFNPIGQDNPDVSTALAVNEDGSVVLGTSGVGPPLAMIWTPEAKMLYLGTFLKNRGITGFDRWILLEATAMSADGKVIVGSGFDSDGVQQAFVVQLTEPAH